MMTIGGILVPYALMQHNKVTMIPISPKLSVYVFSHQQYCASAIFFYVNMVQNEGFQTKEVIINNGQ
jgi:hypothetical protein